MDSARKVAESFSPWKLGREYGLMQVVRGGFLVQQMILGLGASTGGAQEGVLMKLGAMSQGQQEGNCTHGDAQQRHLREKEMLHPLASTHTWKCIYIYIIIIKA